MTERREQGVGVRTWMALQYLAIVGYVGALAAIAFMGADLLFVIVAAAMVTLGMVFFVSPRRSWWAPEVRELLRDPVEARRYRVRMTIALVVVLLAAPPVMALLVTVVGLVSS